MSLRTRYLLTTLALVVIGLGFARVQQWPRREAPRLPAGSGGPARPAFLPAAALTAREILDRASDLALTPDQRGRLAVLDRQWRDESLNLEAAVRAAGEELGTYLRGARQGGKANLQEILRQSEDYRGLSAELRERRRLHADATAHILTGSQQRKLAQLASPEPRGGVQ